VIFLCQNLSVELQNISLTSKSIRCLPISKQKVQVNEQGNESLQIGTSLGQVDCNERLPRRYGFFMHL
jgi:hypothetical protein